MKAKFDAIIQPEQAQYLDGLLTQNDPLLAEMEAYAAEHRVPIADREVARFVEITARITAVEGRKVTFDVSAKDELDTVSAGTHTRFVVEVARTKDRLKAKAAKLAALTK